MFYTPLIKHQNANKRRQQRRQKVSGRLARGVCACQRFRPKSRPPVGFAEFERALIRERQREGIALAKKRGAYRGRKKLLSVEQVKSLRKRLGEGVSKAQLARELGISRETLYQYLRDGD